MSSIQISIEANGDQQDILVSSLSDLGADGFEQTDTVLTAYFNEHTFKSYEVNEALKGFVIHTATIADQNWNAVWESNFQPVTVEGFCEIRAAFHQPSGSVPHEIIITPKMSFGTGHHATTYMMIEQMKDLDLSRKTVFDFGTGTGILAILARKLGASAVTAIDVDEWSIANAEENMAANQCTGIAVFLSSQIPAGPFDIILANINRNVLLDYMAGLAGSLQPKGSLLLSGLLTSDETDIMEACTREGFTLLKKTGRENWIALLLLRQ